MHTWFAIVLTSLTMAPIKSKEHFFEKDPTNDFFGLLTLENLYEHAGQYCHLHDGVPDDVRSFFNAVVTLWLYGWLYYPFYTLADFLSSVAVEMALRQRLPPRKLDKRSRDRRTLKHLLQEAKAVGFLRDENFPSLKNRHASAERLDEMVARIAGNNPEPKSFPPYADVLIERLPLLRNSFAHPKMHAIMPPGPVLDSLMVAAEIVNQLWPRSK